VDDGFWCEDLDARPDPSGSRQRTQRPPRVREQILTRNDRYPGPREEPQEWGQPRVVAPAVDVLAVRVEERRVQRPRLCPVGAVMVVLRHRPLHGIADEVDEPRARDQRGHARGDVGLGRRCVARRGLPAHRGRGRELVPIPADAAVAVALGPGCVVARARRRTEEEVELLRVGHRDLGMTVEEPVQGRRAALHRADDHQVRQGAGVLTHGRAR